MAKIAIFVSHRIDINSKCIKNSLYHHMRCGAVFDKRNGVKIPGDDTGDNISEKQKYFSEFTVQYWAWKNFDADYYGLCHYRRYFSFANQEFPTEMFQGFIEEQQITRKATSRYKLTSPHSMAREIKKYDVIYGKPYLIENTPTRGSQYRNYYELLVKHKRTLFTDEILELVQTLVQQRFPQYYPSMIKRLNSNELIGFNLFIMRKDLFFQMCEFEFDIMMQMEQMLDLSRFEGNSIRIIGYIGELLYGTYIQWLKDQQKYKMAEKQMVLFWKPEAPHKAKNLSEMKSKIRELAKKFWLNISPAYRVLRRVEEVQKQEMAQLNSNKKTIVLLEQIMQRLELSIWLSRPEFPEDISELKLRFWNSYPKAEGDLRTIQIGNMWMLHRMKEICDQLNICFWLHGGSLVGGVRHQGYIPWDDDIDVGMMRKDFIKLKEFLYTNAQYKVQDIYYTVLSCRSYRFMRRDIPSNNFVDIFIYDDYSPTEEDIQYDWGKLIDYKLAMGRQYTELVQQFGIIPNNVSLDDTPELKESLDKLIDLYCARIFCPNETDWITWGLDNNFENPSRPAWKLGRIFRRSDIFPLQTCCFEGEEMYIPNNFRKYVFTEYGIDFLEMPKDMGTSKHLKNYFSHKEDLDKVKALIADEEGKR